MSSLNTYLLSIFIISTFAGCEILNPDEEIPAYLFIDSITLNTNISAEGSKSSNVKDVWCFINDDFAGAFELPVTIPIVHGGTAKVSLFGGIFKNGSSGSRESYPFYTALDTTLNLGGGANYNLNPVLKYTSFADFAVVDDFELGTVFVKENGDTNILVTADPQQVFEGSKSGLIYLDNSHFSFEGATTDKYQLPAGGNTVYVELNYKCNKDFQIGMFGHGGVVSIKQYTHIISEKPEWNKIYLDFTSVVGGMKANYNTTEYQVMIKVNKQAGESDSWVYLDNFKLIY